MLIVVRFELKIMLLLTRNQHLKFDFTCTTAQINLELPILRKIAP